MQPKAYDHFKSWFRRPPRPISVASHNPYEFSNQAVNQIANQNLNDSFSAKKVQQFLKRKDGSMLSISSINDLNYLNEDELSQIIDIHNPHDVNSFRSTSTVSAVNPLHEIEFSMQTIK